MEFNNKVALVTGSGRGIGRAIALRLAARGAEIAIAEIIADNAYKVADEIRELGQRADVHILDVTVYDQVTPMVSEVMAAFGRIDILVNTVGWDQPRAFIDTSPADWGKVLAVNLRSTMNVTHAVLGHMIERQQGRIVNIASDAGRMGAIFGAAYSAAKAGVIAFSKTIAREVARYNILVNCVAPGPVDTPLVAEVSQGEAGASMLRKTLRAVPLKRIGQPEEIAYAVAFFASEEASYVTGQVLSVNGGMIMSD